MVETFVTVREAYKDQSDLLVETMNFKSKIKPQNPEKRQQKKDILQNLHALFDGKERGFDAFDSGIFPIKIEATPLSEKVSNHSNLKILTPKQVLQILPIAVAQVKADNTSENLLNKIRQIIYSLYRV